MLVDSCVVISKISSLLKERFAVASLDIIDQTHKHKLHKHYVAGKVHVKIIIEAKELNGLSMLAAHKQIMQVLQPLFASQLHAVIIKVVR